MAVLSKVKLNPQQRLDLEDYNAEISAIETDFKNWTKQFFAPEQYVLKGFEITGIGAPSPVSVSLTDATLVNANNTNCFSFFTAQDGAAPLAVNLQPNQRNFLELQLSRVDGTPLVRAFWDPTGNGGEGIEFNQSVDTIQDLEVNVVVNTSAFTGSTDTIPLAIIDTDGSNNVELVLDKRPMYFRLGQPGDAEKNFTWGSQNEPAVELALSSVSGVFIQGETLNFTGGASAELLSGTSTPLQAVKFSSDSFAIGDTVTGATSGATGTLVTASESFSGADKNIGDFKESLDAIMTEIKAIKGTDFWFDDGFKSLSGAFDQHNSVMVQLTSNAKFAWSGTELSITDNSGTPADVDNIGKIVIFGESGVFNLTRQDGTGGSSTIPIADGEMLYVEIPNSGSQNFSGVGATASNYRVINSVSYVQSDENYWLAYREGSKLYLRGLQELEVGEEQEIGDEISGDLLDALGIPENDPTPNYTSDIRGSAGESFLDRISTLTLNQGDYQEDRSGFLRSDDPVVWDGSQVTFGSDIELRIPNTKSGTYATYTIQAAQSPIVLSDGEMAYVSIDRTSPGNVIPSTATSIPPQVQAAKDIIVLFQRIDAASGAFLHIPFHKQVLRQGQNVFLGASGSGGGVTRVDLHDPLTTTLPTGASATIDGVSVANGDLVLFSNLGSGDNQVYEVQGVGSSITWTAQFAFETGQTPDDGDLVVIQRGDSFADQIGKFNGTEWEFNKTTRYFDGENYVEFEALKTVTLTDNTSLGTVFSVNASSSNNWIIHVSLERGSTKEVKTLHLTHDGTTVSVSESGTDLGADSGIDFTAAISGSDLILQYNSTPTGNDATMKFFYYRWSDTAGGPGGVPTYSGAASSSVTAAGATGDIQFKDSGGGLGANSKFNWDNSNEVLNLNTLEVLPSQAALTLVNDQTSPTAIYTFNATTYRYVIIEYAVERDGEFRTGRMMVSNNGTTVGFSDDFVETPGLTGINFSAAINAGNVEIRYDSTDTGVDGSLEIMQIRRM